MAFAPSRTLWQACRRAALDALFPARCVLCGQAADHAQWCRACRASLPRLPTHCPRCALPAAHGEVCGACLKKPPPFDTTFAACRYTFPLDRLLQDFKYGHRLALAVPLAQLLIDAHRAASPPSPVPSCLVALPLARRRQIERGFNQAQELARRIAGELRLPLLTDALHRTRDAPKQALLPWAERHKNVRGAFACTTPLAGAHVALIDDVMTTGATAAAAAHALRQAGAAHVAVWVVARAVADPATDFH